MTAAVCTLLSIFVVFWDMYSVGINDSDGSLFLETGTPKPELRNGDVMIKVRTYKNMCIFEL